MDSSSNFLKSSIAISLILVNILLLAVGFNFIKTRDSGNQPLRDVYSERVIVLTADGSEELGASEAIPQENLQADTESDIDDNGEAERAATEKLESQQLNDNLKELPSLSEVASSELTGLTANELLRGAELAAKELALNDQLSAQKSANNTSNTNSTKSTNQPITAKEVVPIEPGTTVQETAKLNQDQIEQTCVRIGPFNEQWFTRMTQTLASNEIDYVTERKLEQVLPLYRVYLGPFLTTNELKGAKEHVAKAASIVEYYVFRDADDALPYISFGVFSSKDRARNYSEKLSSMGIDVSARQEGEKVVAGHWVVLPRGLYKSSIAPELEKVRYRVLESDCFSLKR